MKSSTKKLIIAIVVVVVVIAVLLGVFFATRPATSEGHKAFTVEVTHADGSTKTFNYRTDAEYAGEVLLEKGLIAGDDGPYGLYVKEVDGEMAVYEDNQAYWSLIVNGEYAMQGIDQTPVNDGDVIGLVYTIG